ncbi:hypothetical protein J6590_089839 [Homalodisca vitripennis]|nr:hypothetical protein J6590_093160 [Homalodisca vitripennis]KAG8299913.1 hypothetical protein J6590_089839 [Homalodisca vitripennis]
MKQAIGHASFLDLDGTVNIAEFMHMRTRKCYSERREIPRCKELLRFESESLDFLAHAFLPENEETRGKALLPRQKMEVFWGFVGDLGFQSGIGEDLGTVCKTIDSVLNNIEERSVNWIHFPARNNKINEAKLLWQRRFRLSTNPESVLHRCRIEAIASKLRSKQYVCKAIAQEFSGIFSIH